VPPLFLGDQTPAVVSLRSIVTLALSIPAFALRAGAQDVPPPRPHLPIPTAAQLAWQRDEMRMFIHFGMNTFTDREWGTGEEDPANFRPDSLGARQWARVAARTGFRTVVLTAKHHDGFALWPTALSHHSVAASTWRGGEGDVVRELADAVAAEGLGLGLYLSPWDRHEPTYGDEEAYNAHYMGQLRELLTGYGPVVEVWFDGAKGEDARDMRYDFAAWWSLVRQLQPGAVLFSDAGPDVRWIGNERGAAGETNWSTYDRSRVGVGMAGIEAYLNTGERGAPDWVPGECDVSIRPGWFHHADERPRTLGGLLDLYYSSVGRNCLLLLNVPPAPSGRLDEADVAALDSLAGALRVIFGRNLAEGSTTTSSSVRGNSARFSGERALDGDLDTYWAPGGTDAVPTVPDSPVPGAHTALLEIGLPAPATFNVIRLQEPVQFGQRIAAFRVEASTDGRWRTVARGTTIGHQRLLRMEVPVTATAIRIVVEDALALPLLAEVGLHRDPYPAARR
jgi:alpha-L-fucosidase